MEKSAAIWTEPEEEACSSADYADLYEALSAPHRISVYFLICGKDCLWKKAPRRQMLLIHECYSLLKKREKSAAIWTEPEEEACSSA